MPAPAASISPGDSERRVVVGILALQGAFIEHKTALEKLPGSRKLQVIFVKTPDELARCDALIIPGGESTTIALLARISGVLDPLRAFIKHKPVWGTCAGAILLSHSVQNAKKGGQDLLGGMSITIARNGWGSQVESFEAALDVPGLRNPEDPFTGVFIRAPVVLKLTPGPSDPPIQVIAKLSPHLLPSSLSSNTNTNTNTNANASLNAGTDADADVDVDVNSNPNPDIHTDDDPKTYVALRQGLHFLTTFHPELTSDNRFHEYFVNECVLGAAGAASPSTTSTSTST